MDLKHWLAGSALLTLLAVAAPGDTRTRVQTAVRIVDEGRISNEWMVADNSVIVAPRYPAQFVSRPENVCVAIGYLIGRDGTTSDYSVVKTWNGATGSLEPEKGYWDAFTRAGVLAVTQWKFKPRPEVVEPRPTYTVASLYFKGDGTIDGTGSHDECAIADLAYEIQEAHSDLNSRRYGIGYDRNRYLREGGNIAYTTFVDPPYRNPAIANPPSATQVAKSK